MAQRCGSRFAAPSFAAHASKSVRSAPFGVRACTAFSSASRGGGDAPLLRKVGDDRFSEVVEDVMGPR